MAVPDVFDKAGNWDWFTLGSDPNTPYIPDNLNLYASINDPNAPTTPTESFTYDKDQNLTEDGSFEYASDAENRLTEVVPAEDDPNNLTADDKKLVFTYDYLNRRVRKLVYAWDPNEGESGDWSATAELDLRYIYHERLLLLELDGLDSNAKVRKHVWGPGSDGRLGGRNSLLGVRDIDSTTNYVCFNNGTGSVAQLLDRSDGSVDAKYVYDTRGDTVRNTGPFADDNPLRYNGWYFDAELDYAGTECDGLYSLASGGFAMPRLGRVSSPKMETSLCGHIDGDNTSVARGPLSAPPRIEGSLPPDASPAAAVLCSKTTTRVTEFEITGFSSAGDSPAWDIACGLLQSYIENQVREALSQTQTTTVPCPPGLVCVYNSWTILDPPPFTGSTTIFTEHCTFWVTYTVDMITSIMSGNCVEVEIEEPASQPAPDPVPL